MTHVFPSNLMLEAAREALDVLAAFIRQELA